MELISLFPKAMLQWVMQPPSEYCKCRVCSGCTHTRQQSYECLFSSLGKNNYGTVNLGLFWHYSFCFHMKTADLSFLVCSMLVVRLTWYYRLRATFSRDDSLDLLHETVDQNSPLVPLLNIFLLITFFQSVSSSQHFTWKISAWLLPKRNNLPGYWVSHMSKGMTHAKVLTCVVFWEQYLYPRVIPILVWFRLFSI